jgi:hypothetical protein
MNKTGVEAMNPEESDFLSQRRQELLDEISRLSVAKSRPGYVDPTEQLQDLQDQLDEIESLIGDDAPDKTDDY